MKCAYVMLIDQLTRFHLIETDMKNPKSYRQPFHSPLLLLLLIISLFLYKELVVVGAQNINGTMITTTVNVGVILDLETWVGKMAHSCLSMALSDFYSTNPNYKTRLVLHTRDSKKDIIDAASSAIDLLKNIQVQAIIGPQKSFQAEFVASIGNKTQVPVISFSATSPKLSFSKTPYFIRTALNDSCQVKAIGDMIKAFGWREVVPIYEDADYVDLLPNIVDAIQESNAKVPYRSVVSPLATDAQILQELYKLKSMQTRVFVVHMSSSLGARLFMKIREAGMMSKGYAWIVTSCLTELLGSMDSSVIKSMQGVLGVKPYVQGSKDLDSFRTRWRRKFLLDNPAADGTDQLNVFGLWAYDSIQALAMAVEQVFPFSPGSSSSLFKTREIGTNSTDLADIGVSQMGQKLVQAILATSFRGLSGEFRLVDGQLQSSAFQIVNVIGKGEREIGFWTPTHGISKTLDFIDKKVYSTATRDLRAIIWPGDSTVVPKGWEIPTGEKKLMIGVPVKDGFSEFVKVEYDSNRAPKVTGFIVDVFKIVMDLLPYSVPYEFVPFKNPDSPVARDYNDLVYEVYLQNYSAAVGDITITANRSLYVDFVLPFMESGVSMIVPIKNDERKNAWIFLKPLTRNLWLTTGAFFVLTGFVIWVLEHQINNDFRGPPSEQIGMVLWFALSTLVFAQKEKMMSNLSRFVMIIWFFVVLVLTSSYTASFTSMLTVQQLQPTVTDIKDLIKNGDYVGYQRGSFVKGVIESLNIDKSKLRLYDTVEEYDEALSKGSRGGGVSAILEEVPYIKIFLAKYCTKYTMLGPTYKTAGLSFAFPKGSPLVPDISRAILNATEGGEIAAIEKAWFGQQTYCREQGGTTVSSDSLTLDSFLGLFLIAGFTSCSAFFTFIFIFLRENKDILSSQLTIRQKLKLLAKEFIKKKEKKSKPNSNLTQVMNEETSEVTENNDNTNNDNQQRYHSAAIFFQSPDLISQDGGLSSTEPNTPPPGREQPSVVEIT